MNKHEMLDAIESTKQLHIDQMNKIEHLLNGDKIEHPTPIGKMDCECGIWFYNQQDFIIKILGGQLFERLDSLHEKWHFEYVHIYNIFFKEKKVSFFAKITGGGKVDTLEFDKAKFYFLELKETTKNLLQVAESAKRRVAALQEHKFI